VPPAALLCNRQKIFLFPMIFHLTNMSTYDIIAKYRRKENRGHSNPKFEIRNQKEGEGGVGLAKADFNKSQAFDAAGLIGIALAELGWRKGWRNVGEIGSRKAGKRWRMGKPCVRYICDCMI
jgi:hypothetical protein